MFKSRKSGKSDTRDAKDRLKGREGQMLPGSKIGTKKHPLDLEKGKTSQRPEQFLWGSKGKSRFPWIKKGMGYSFPTSTSWYTEKMIIFQQRR